MLFNSFEFIFFFLPFTYLIYFSLNKYQFYEIGKAFLVLSSLFFYSWWNIIYLPIILISILINYFIGSYLLKPSNQKKNLFTKKHVLILGVMFNVTLLGYFKYSDFFIVNFNSVTNSSLTLLNLTLPLAISFFTFQQIAYLVDSFKKQTKEYNFLNYSLFVSFFPQLIAGPIVHHKEMMPQFNVKGNKSINTDNFALGLYLFSIGLFKKVVIADTFATWANYGFDTTLPLSFFEAWGASFSYSFQLYFDFSGYTDMAIGLAMLFNIRLPINFNSPYKARNIQDFWRRWHITLSRFLRDYIYIPLGGNRKGSFSTYTNLMATFVIGGIWHGAGWTFIFWGFLHGFALVIHRFWTCLRINMWAWLAWLITFSFVNFAWVFFRAKDWNSALKLLSEMFTFKNIVISKTFAEFINYINPSILLSSFEGETMLSTMNIFTLEMIIIGFFITVKMDNSIELSTTYEKSKIVSNKNILLSIFAFGISLIIMSLQTGSEFLYFNF